MRKFFSLKKYLPKLFSTSKNQTNSKQKALSQLVWSDPKYFISFGFGSGLSPKAPGTFGTFAALPLYYLICHTSNSIYLTISIISFFVGVKIVDDVSKKLGEHDYPGIVWDEIVGYFFVMFMVPVSLIHTILGLALFRLFDIWKPFPICWLDKRVKGGFGVMIDDFIAAIFAWVALQIIIRII